MTSKRKRRDCVEEVRRILRRPYSRVLVPEEDGRFSAKVLEFEGCFSQGETIEDAYKNLDRAAVNWVATAMGQGMDIPLPLCECKPENGRMTSEDLEKFHDALREDGAAWVKRTGWKRFSKAARLTPDQEKKFLGEWQSYWNFNCITNAPFERVIFVQRKLAKFEYVKNPRRGKMPMPAEKTFETMRGDCKDFAVLAAAMLHTIGLQPYIELQAPGGGKCLHVRCHEMITDITMERRSPNDRQAPWADSWVYLRFGLFGTILR